MTYVFTAIILITLFCYLRFSKSFKSFKRVKSTKHFKELRL